MFLQTEMPLGKWKELTFFTGKLQLCLSQTLQICMQVCMYVCMYVHMYVCMYVCTYVCMYVCMYAMYVHTYVHMYVWYGMVWYGMVWYGRFSLFLPSPIISYPPCALTGAVGALTCTWCVFFRWLCKVSFSHFSPPSPPSYGGLCSSPCSSSSPSKRLLALRSSLLASRLSPSSSPCRSLSSASSPPNGQFCATSCTTSAQATQESPKQQPWPVDWHPVSR